VDRAEKIRVGGNRLENNGTGVLLTVGQNHVYAVDAEWVALAAFGPRAWPALGRNLFFLAFAFLERIEVIEDVVADLLEILRDAAC
jgi:hypothetical protein